MRGTSLLLSTLGERARNTTRTMLRSGRASARWLRASDRPLPSFVIVGTQRGGTTSLHQDLSKHPKILEPIGKELQFFSCHYGRGERYYRSHFPFLRPGEQTFESSPYYLFHPMVPGRAAAMLPNAKFVVLLRDPVLRAYSHYCHSRALGVEKLSFAQALAAEPSRLEEAKMLGLESRRGRSLHRNFSYVSRGLYTPQLQRWLTAVPRSRLTIIKSEDLYANPTHIYTQLIEYLGLPPFTPDTFAKSNARAWGQPGDGIEGSIYRDLRETFAPDGVRLRSLLGWDTSWE